jgi:hypothetical protein
VVESAERGLVRGLQSVVDVVCGREPFFGLVVVAGSVAARASGQVGAISVVVGFGLAALR